MSGYHVGGAPSPKPGDAGKVLVVNETEDGFDLATPGGGGSGLPSDWVIVEPDSVQGSDAAGSSYLRLNESEGDLFVQSTPATGGYVEAFSDADVSYVQVQASVGQTDPMLVLYDENGDPVLTSTPDGQTTAGDVIDDAAYIAPGSLGVMIGGDTLFSVGDGGGGKIALSAALPTVDPGVPGLLWNDAGTVKVSAG